MTTTISDNPNITKLHQVIKQIRKKHRDITDLQLKNTLKKYGTDDELDFAISTDFNIKNNQTENNKRILFVLPILIGIICYLIPNFSIEEKIYSFFGMLVLFIPAIIFTFFRIDPDLNKKIKIDNILLLDFHGKYASKKLNDQISSYFHPIFTTSIIFQCNFDQRQTVISDLISKSKIDPDNSYNNHISIIQYLSLSNLPKTYVITRNNPIEFILNKNNSIKLESNDFNDRFSIYSENPTDAFYVFNPELMEKLINDYDQFHFESMVINQNYIILIYQNPFNFLNNNSLNFNEYLKHKSNIIHCLNTISNISDILERTPHDNPTKRSPASKI